MQLQTFKHILAAQRISFIANGYYAHLETYNVMNIVYTKCNKNIVYSVFCVQTIFSIISFRVFEQRNHVRNTKLNKFKLDYQMKYEFSKFRILLKFWFNILARCLIIGRYFLSSSTQQQLIKVFGA